MLKNIHATCLDCQGHGVLLLGASGSGKSDLALRLIYQHQAVLVADDRTDLSADGTFLTASAPSVLSGLLEVRGVGIMKMPFVDKTTLALAVELVSSPAEVERLPQNRYYECGGVKIPLLKLYPFEASAPAKVAAALSCENFGLSC